MAKQVLDAVSVAHDVPVIVADVTDHPQVASAQHVYRAPTTFVVDERGRAVARISGVPREGELDAILAPASVSALEGT